MASGPVEDVWDRFEQSGFLDALVPEAAGGGGLPLAACAPLFQALGRRPVPLTVGETMLARAMLAVGSVGRPGGAILLLAPAANGAGYTQRDVPMGQGAGHALAGPPRPPSKTRRHYTCQTQTR